MWYILVGKIDIGGIRLNFWDLGGQEELQSLWDKVRFISCNRKLIISIWHQILAWIKCANCKVNITNSRLRPKGPVVPVAEKLIRRSNIYSFPLQYYAESHAVIYMVDSSDRERIEESKTAFGKIRLQFWWNGLATH